MYFLTLRSFWQPYSLNKRIVTYTLKYSDMNKHIFRAILEDSLSKQNSVLDILFVNTKNHFVIRKTCWFFFTGNLIFLHCMEQWEWFCNLKNFDNISKLVLLTEGPMDTSHCQLPFRKV